MLVCATRACCQHEGGWVPYSLQSLGGHSPLLLRNCDSCATIRPHHRISRVNRLQTSGHGPWTTSSQQGAVPVYTVYEQSMAREESTTTLQHVFALEYSWLGEGLWCKQAQRQVGYSAVALGILCIFLPRIMYIFMYIFRYFAKYRMKCMYAVQ